MIKYRLLAAAVLLSGLAHEPARAQTLVWAKALGGVNSQYATDIHLGKDNKLYVSGYFDGTCDFDPGPGVVNKTAVGTSAAFVAKYDTSGNLFWANNIDTDSWDDGISVGVDHNSNVFVLGSYYSISDIDPGPSVYPLTVAGDRDIYVAKYGIAGNFLWGFPLAGAHWDSPGRLYVDAADNVIICGSYMDSIDFDPGAGVDMRYSNGLRDPFLAKYDQYGNFLWANTQGSAYDDLLADFSIGADGNLYTTGWFSDTIDLDPGPGVANHVSAGNYDLFYAVYNPSGNYISSVSFGGAGNEYGSRILRDSDGSIYLAGQFDGPLDLDPGAGTTTVSPVGGFYDIFFGHYDAAGNLLFAGTFGDIGVDYVNGMELDAAGDVIMAGNFAYTVDFDPGTGVLDFATAGFTDNWMGRYDGSTGSLVWAAQTGGAGLDYCFDLVLDNADHIFTTGCFSDTVDFDPQGGTMFLTSVDKKDAFFAKYNDELVTSVLASDGLPTLSVFPNPTDGRIGLHVNIPLDEVVLTNSLGQEVMRFAPSCSTRFDLDLGALPGGIYYLHGKGGGRNIVQKISRR